MTSSKQILLETPGIATARADSFRHTNRQSRPSSYSRRARFAVVSLLNVGGSPALTSAEIFDSSSSLPEITGTSVSGKTLFVEGQNFDDGARVYLDDEKQKTANESATTLLRNARRQAG